MVDKSGVLLTTFTPFSLGGPAHSDFACDNLGSLQHGGSHEQAALSGHRQRDGPGSIPDVCSSLSRLKSALMFAALMIGHHLSISARR